MLSRSKGGSGESLAGGPGASAGLGDLAGAVWRLGHIPEGIPGNPLVPGKKPVLGAALSLPEAGSAQRLGNGVWGGKSSW